MINNKRQISTERTPFLWYLLPAFLLSMAIGCASAIHREQADIIRNVGFSPDGKRMIFNLQKGDKPYMIHTYDMESGDLNAYASPAGEKWDYPQFSSDGKYIVFVSFPVEVIPATQLHPEKMIENPEKSQIAVMNADGTHVKKITNSTGYKAYPSFSHSGRKIIFARSDVMEEKPQVGIKWTICEADVRTGRETPLSEFKFFAVSKPYYFPDDKNFIFGGEYLTGYPGVPDSNKDTESFRKVEKKRKELKARYKENAIYVMQANERDLKPFLTPPRIKNKYGKGHSESNYAKWPSLSADGSVLVFKAQGFKPDGSADYDHLYQYSPDGNHRSIMPMPPTESMAAVSSRGETIALIPKPSRHIIIYQLKDGQSREVSLPDQPTRIINGK